MYILMKEALENRRNIYSKLVIKEDQGIDGYLILQEKYGNQIKRINYNKFVRVINQLGLSNFEENEK